MKWEAVTLIAYFGFNLAAHSTEFLKKMDRAVDPSERSTHRMAFTITVMLLGLLIACVIRLAR